jgi:hypothetical protein
MQPDRLRMNRVELIPKFQGQYPHRAYILESCMAGHRTGFRGVAHMLDLGVYRVDVIRCCCRMVGPGMADAKS